MVAKKKGFDALPTPVKIIIFQAIANVLFSISEYALTIEPTDYEMVVRQGARFIVLTMLNVATWYLTQLKSEVK